MKIRVEITMTVAVIIVQTNTLIESNSDLNRDTIQSITLRGKQSQLIWKAKIPSSSKTVSYTHLTLPTIAKV